MGRRLLGGRSTASDGETDPHPHPVCCSTFFLISISSSTLLVFIPGLYQTGSQLSSSLSLTLPLPLPLSFTNTHSERQYSFPISVTSTFARLNFGHQSLFRSLSLSLLRCSCHCSCSFLPLIRMLTGFTLFSLSAFSTHGDTLCTHVFHFHNLLRVGSVTLSSMSS